MQIQTLSSYQYDQLIEDVNQGRRLGEVLDAISYFLDNVQVDEIIAGSPYDELVYMTARKLSAAGIIDKLPKAPFVNILRHANAAPRQVFMSGLAQEWREQLGPGEVGLSAEVHQIKPKYQVQSGGKRPRGFAVKTKRESFAKAGMKVLRRPKGGVVLRSAKMPYSRVVIIKRKIKDQL